MITDDLVTYHTSPRFGYPDASGTLGRYTFVKPGTECFLRPAPDTSCTFSVRPLYRYGTLMMLLINEFNPFHQPLLTGLLSPPTEM